MSEPEPPHPDRLAPEREMLFSFLDFYRSVMIRKVEGVDRDGLRMSPVESGTSLGGLIKHLAYVERSWFQRVWAAREVEFPWADEDPDADFRLDADEDADVLIEFYRQECDASRAIAAASHLDDTVETPRGKQLSLRWLMVHMIEETARHAGHADLLREMIDGSVGD
ncbi:MAG TPA: DinB family protein [Acidimicrobiia bacterium]|nr:DinB family protein [Acidimicrobiia bacterium]